MTQVDLPQEFARKMKELLGDEYDAYLESFQQQRLAGLRLNTMRLECDPPEWIRKLPWPVKPVPWTSNGFYYDETVRPSKDSYYFAGLYYLQEPSAMAPAAVLPIEPGHRVLDLCAAPGGKSTELGARLCGQGVLVSNDISASRAKALLKNLELWGIDNLYVTSEEPGHLAQVFPGFFDRILVDAPCSGEGMFRKDPEMIKSWKSRGPEAYVPIQREILTHAVQMLAPDGYLLYSTCTFDVSENEEQIRWLLEEVPKQDLELVNLPLPAGASSGIGLEGCLRLFPHKVSGEGHFLALLHKKGKGQPHWSTPNGLGEPGISGPNRKVAEEFLSHTSRTFDVSRLYQKNESIYYLPQELGIVPGIRYLRTGLWLGDIKRGRFEPSQALAMTLSMDTFDSVVSFTHEDERVIRYLKGETLQLAPQEEPASGWCLVCVDGYPLGFAKSVQGRLKNKYHTGWRW